MTTITNRCQFSISFLVASFTSAKQPRTILVPDTLRSIAGSRRTAVSDDLPEDSHAVSLRTFPASRPRNG